MSTCVNMPSQTKMVQFVDNYAGKAMYASWVSILAPGVVIGTAVAVAAVTRGKVMGPVRWLEQPSVANNVQKWMGASTKVFVGSCAASVAVTPTGKFSKR